MLLSAPASFSKPTTDNTVKSITPAQLAALLRQEGVREDQIPTMVAIGRAESSLNPRALNPDRSTGDYSFGLYQINMIDEPGYPLGAERRRKFGLKANEELYDPKTNVRAAKSILDSQGLGAWSVYKTGAYKQYLPGAEQATSESLSSFAEPTSSMPQPVAPPPPVEKEAPVNVLALKDGVQGVLDKTSGEFTARDFTDEEAKRYEQYGGVIPRSVRFAKDFAKNYFLR
tara:strand:- start:541 stop:1227 length:687 start_codon:yes stop_codon:yes gene_type:complete